MRVIVTGVNADIGGEYVSEFIAKFSSFNSVVTFHQTLGAENYLSLMNYGKKEKVILAGNSSSIVKEVPFFECKGILIGAGKKVGNLEVTQYTLLLILIKLKNAFLNVF